jgi:hypothetical protein
MSVPITESGPSRVNKCQDHSACEGLMLTQCESKWEAVIFWTRINDTHSKIKHATVLHSVE